MHLDRRAGADVAGDVSVAFEIAQVLGEHALRDVADEALDRGETLRPVLQRQKDQRLPLAHHLRQNLADGAEAADFGGEGGYGKHTKCLFSA